MSNFTYCVSIIEFKIGLQEERKNFGGLQNSQEGTCVPEVIMNDVQGPYHTVLKLGLEKKIHELFTIKNEEVLKVYLFDILPYSVRKIKWNTHSKKFKMSQFVTRSDEAFALLIIENNAPKWLDELYEPNKAGRDRVKSSVYTQGIETCGLPGWSEEGIDRFVHLGGVVRDTYKNNLTDHKNKCDTLVQSKYSEDHKLNSRERATMKRMKNSGVIKDRAMCREENKRKKRKTHQLISM